MNAQKRDANEREIVVFLRSAGCAVMYMDRKTGFDLLVLSTKGIHIVEIKDPSKIWYLTEREIQVKDTVERHRSKYEIIKSIEEAQAMIEL